ncbi:hypothetical protein F2Q70_00037207 [Brassica cretica]|uniref:Protein kinase domain-containing protein n=1 Tax=Brassica cretica TaxID=69181 RepID=A0A8S9JS59_BRACR|nr:hypothetical protein F2Q70_00037207 [Brassica cretica]
MQLFTSCCGKGFEGKKKVETEPARKIFSLKELHSATNSFNYDNKLGEGRFGSVYWGQLSDGSQVNLISNCYIDHGLLVQSFL